jgi:hypothetical protein
MKVLLVWEEVPETTNFFLLEGDLADLAMQAHNCFINTDTDPNDAADRLNRALGERKITPINVDQPIAIKDLGIDHVVLAGFVL